MILRCGRQHSRAGLGLGNYVKSVPLWAMLLGAGLTIPLIAALSFVAGALFASSRPEQWEIDQDYRETELDNLFRRYLSGEVSAVYRVPLLPGASLDVTVVDDEEIPFRGFVKMIRYPHRLWIQGRYVTVKRYNEEYLYVLFDEILERELVRQNKVRKVGRGSRGGPDTRSASGLQSNKR